MAGYMTVSSTIEHVFGFVTRNNLFHPTLSQCSIFWGRTPICMTAGMEHCEIMRYLSLAGLFCFFLMSLSIFVTFTIALLRSFSSNYFLFVISGILHWRIVAIVVNLSLA